MGLAKSGVVTRMTGVSPLLRAWLSCVRERKGDEKVDPETLLCECEQRNGVIAGIRQRLACLLYFEKHSGQVPGFQYLLYHLLAVRPHIFSYVKWG